MATIPEVRLLERGAVRMIATVMFAPREDEVEGCRWYYALTSPEGGNQHWGYTRGRRRAWQNVRRTFLRRAAAEELRDLHTRQTPPEQDLSAEANR